MRTTIIILVLLVSNVGLADPVMRTYHKWGPLLGKVKTVRSYVLMTTNETEVRNRGQKYYSLDSYNHNKQMVLSYYVQGGEVSAVTQCFYDDKGQLLEQVDSSTKDGYVTREVYTYNMLGQCTYKRIYRVGNFSHLERNIYHKGLRVTKIDSGRYLFRRTDFMYYPDGKPAQKIERMNDGDMAIKYTYDAEGRMLTEARLYDRQRATTTTYTYDKYGNEVLAVEGFTGTRQGRRFESEYIYDSVGNWVKAVVETPFGSWDNPVSKSMTIREISYYE